MIVLIENKFGHEVRGLLKEHLQEMAAGSPPESVHALPLDELKQKDVTFWCAWQKPAQAAALNSTGRLALSDEPEDLMGFVALKQLTQQHAELKSMRTARAYQRKGVATTLLAEVLRVARLRKYQRVSLETGAQLSFQPARELYKRFSFEFCGPFAGYSEDPNSCYMSCLL